MQAFKAKIKLSYSKITQFALILLILLLLGCGKAAVSTSTSPPTSSTPTTAVIIQPTAAVQLPTHTAHPPFDGQSIGDPYVPGLGNRGYDVSHYTLQMALDPAVTNVVATVQIDGMVTTPDLAQLSFDFVGFDISELLLNGKPVDFSRNNDKLILSPTQLLPENSPFTISVSYEGAPVKRPSPFAFFAESLGMQFVAGESIYVLSEPDGARFWFPNNDHPRDKATYRFELTVPAGLTAVANGHLLDQIDTATDSTFIWEHDFPMASYLVTVVVDELVRLEDVSSDGILLRHYASPDGKARFETAVASSAEAIDWMSERFGSYPFEAFGFVSVDLQGVSLETQTMVLLADDMMGERTAIHELAHMWFGDWVSLDSWQEMWRNEGFATYVQLMWETQDDPEDLALIIEAFKTNVADNNDQHPLGNPPPIQLFGFNTYIQGAVMVHELRLVVGDDAFFTGLQTYFATYGGGTASDAQFQAVMEEASGKSLDAFFAEWLE